ncbi:MFS transporter [Desulfoferrobacter suflitae]|uniref:MFS transporter n=1 Tax=Desulfoferrobacter suflitae TaxID=2865782 RepID=UPI00216481CD|nr:MFS transporter [Desulfoferrobacter suflitae]MCK8602097.1 MFS transporter [Desulfoferrobacter suflitae]
MTDSLPGSQEIEAQGDNLFLTLPKLIPLFFLTTIFFTNFFARIIASPLMPSIEADLHVNHSQAGVLFLVIAAGYFVTLAGSGFVSCRLTHRRTIILSALVLGLAFVATSFSNTLSGMSIGLLVVGMATGLYLPSGIATLTSLISPQHWGKAIGVHELAPNTAFVIAPLVAELFLSWFSWRAVLTAVGATSFFIGVAYAIWGRGGDFPGEAPAFSSIRALFHERKFWVMVALFSLGIGGSVGVYAMLPLYLVDGRGMNLSWTNTVVATSRIIPLAMSLLSGWAADRFGKSRTITMVLLFTGLLTVLIGIVPDSWVVLVVFLQPMLSVCFFPAALAALSSIGPASARNVVVSFTIPLSFLLGAGAIPTLIGFLGNRGCFALGIVAAGGLIMAGAFLTRYFEPRARR